MRFAPKSEEEIKANNPGGFAPWKAGEYDFEVSKAEDAVSKASGADMIKLTLFVYDSTGSKRTVFDYLLASVEYKLRHAAEACGLLGDYERGELEAMSFEGKTGRLKLGVKPATEGFEANNNVRDYIVTGEIAGATKWQAPQRRAVAGRVNDLDDEVPF